MNNDELRKRLNYIGVQVKKRSGFLMYVVARTKEFGEAFADNDNELSWSEADSRSEADVWLNRELAKPSKRWRTGKILGNLPDPDEKTSPSSCSTNACIGWWIVVRVEQLSPSLPVGDIGGNVTRFRFKVKGGYVIGALDIPTDVGSVCVAAVGGSKAEALMRAATIAQRISEDPVMAALMPPQATAAIAAAKALSVAAKRGPAALKSLWSRIKGPGKQRLAAALHEEATQESGYFGKRSSVRQPNRGAWQSWQDPYYGDEHDDDDDAESYDADAYPDIDLEGVGRRRRRSKRSYRPREADERDSEPDPDAPIDEPEAQGTERTGAVDGDE